VTSVHFDNGTTWDHTALLDNYIAQQPSTSGDDHYYGTYRNETIATGDGDDVIYAGGGDDLIDGGAGNDIISGGTGTDTLDYSARTGNWMINVLSGVATSGSETDSFSSIENATGGSGADTISGNFAANVLTGGAGDDTLNGGNGNDTLIGGDGDDRLTGGVNDDQLIGGAGSDLAVFAGLQASYSLTTGGGSIMIVDNQPSTDGNDGTDTLSGVETAEFKGGVQVTLAPPIVLDLNGDGVTLISPENSSTSFDWNGDGRADASGWIGADDGFLVFDRNGDGKVSDASELSFVDDKPGAKSDLDGLSAFDSNHDGIFSAADDKFGSFAVWRDANSDGISGAGEFVSLANSGVKSISLAGTAVDQTWAWNENIVINAGSFARTDGTTAELKDVALSYSRSDDVLQESAPWPRATLGTHHDWLWQQFDVPIATMPIGSLPAIDGGAGQVSMINRNASLLTESISAFSPSSSFLVDEERRVERPTGEWAFSAPLTMTVPRPVLGI
jgi:Ca2+-binding RTX toxin-like protein